MLGNKLNLLKSYFYKELHEITYGLLSFQLLVAIFSKGLGMIATNLTSKDTNTHLDQTEMYYLIQNNANLKCNYLKALGDKVVLCEYWLSIHKITFNLRETFGTWSTISELKELYSFLISSPVPIVKKEYPEFFI